MEVFNVEVIERFKRQHQQYANVSDAINYALDNDDVEIVGKKLYELADFFKVDLEYGNAEEFIDYFDSVDVITI